MTPTRLVPPRVDEYGVEIILRRGSAIERIQVKRWSIDYTAPLVTEAGEVFKFVGHSGDTAFFDLV